MGFMHKLRKGFKHFSHKASKDLKKVGHKINSGLKDTSKTLNKVGKVASQIANGAAPALGALSLILPEAAPLAAGAAALGQSGALLSHGGHSLNQARINVNQGTRKIQNNIKKHGIVLTPNDQINVKKGINSAPDLLQKAKQKVKQVHRGIGSGIIY